MPEYDTLQAYYEERERLRYQEAPLKVAFLEPQQGYWNHGPKKGGEFTPEPCTAPHPGKGHYVKWGCFALNFWFTAKAGKSWKQARANAKQRLRHLVGVPCIVE